MKIEEFATKLLTCDERMFLVKNARRFLKPMKTPPAEKKEVLALVNAGYFQLSRINNFLWQITANENYFLEKLRYLPDLNLNKEEQEVRDRLTNMAKNAANGLKLWCHIREVKSFVGWVEIEDIIPLVNKVNNEFKKFIERGL